MSSSRTHRSRCLSIVLVDKVRQLAQPATVDCSFLSDHVRVGTIVDAKRKPQARGLG